MASRGKKKNVIPRGYIYIAGAAFALVLLISLIVAIVKLTPSKDVMELNEYFAFTEKNQAAVILDGEYLEVPMDYQGVYGLCDNGNFYLELQFVKDNLDAGFVYDNSEITLRYATTNEIYTATVGSDSIMVDKSVESLGHSALIAQDDTVYVAVDYLEKLVDFQWRGFVADPARVYIDRAGHSKKTATVKKATEIRHLSGPKSPILGQVEKGETITILRDTGKYSFIISDSGVMGFIRSKKIGPSTDEIVENKFSEKTYKHITIGEDILLAWHQVTSSSENSDIAKVVADAGNLDVISPTWFYLNDEKGGISNICSSSYVSFCHENGIQVWAQVNDTTKEEVSTSVVLNKTSARDALVNNLVAAAITNGLDGINLDLRNITADDADSYIQFIRELSIKCEKNDVILAVNYQINTAQEVDVNLDEQAKYADYVIVLGYDEHPFGSEEAGSVDSIGWVKSGLDAVTSSVPSDRVILAMPFFCRVWQVASDGTVSSKAYGIKGIQSYLSSNEITPSWDEASGQNVAEHVKGDSTYKLWIQDEESIERRLKLIDEYGLAGGGFWRLGYDNQSIWNTVAKYL